MTEQNLGSKHCTHVLAGLTASRVKIEKEAVDLFFFLNNFFLLLLLEVRAGCVFVSDMRPDTAVIQTQCCGDR